MTDYTLYAHASINYATASATAYATANATANSTSTTDTSATSTTHHYSTTHNTHTSTSHYPHINLTLTRSNGEYIPHTPHQYTPFPRGIIYPSYPIHSAMQGATDNLTYGDIAPYTSTSIEFAMHQPGNK